MRPASRFLARHWLTLAAVVGAGVLAVAQVVWFRAAQPTVPQLTLVTAGALVALGAFLILLILLLCVSSARLAAPCATCATAGLRATSTGR